jgi:hypothetical protein
MIRPHVDPARVAGHVIDPVGCVAAEFRDIVFAIQYFL